MPIGAFAASGKNVDRLITSLNSQLNQIIATTETKYQELALVDSQSTNLTELYPMEVSSASEVDYGPTEPRNFSDAGIINFSCDVTRIGQSEGKRIPIGIIYDPFKYVQQQAPDLARQCKKIWDRRLARLININGLAQDGVPFFGTHSYNPLKSGSINFTNDITIPGINQASITNILDTFIQIPGYDGKLMNEDMGTPIFATGSMEVKIALDQFFNEGLIAQPLPGGGASVNTRLVGAGRTLFMPELVSEAKGNPLARKRFYVINNQYGNRRAFIVRKVQEPQFYISSGNDDAKHINNSRLFYYEAFGGANYAMPQLAMRCTLPIAP